MAHDAATASGSAASAPQSTTTMGSGSAPRLSRAAQSRVVARIAALQSAAGTLAVCVLRARRGSRHVATIRLCVRSPAAGYWEARHEVAAWLGTSVDELTAGLSADDAGGAVPMADRRRYAVTTRVISMLARVCSAVGGEWRMLASKAQRWLEAHSPGSGAQASASPAATGGATRGTDLRPASAAGAVAATSAGIPAVSVTGLAAPKVPGTTIADSTPFSGVAMPVGHVLPISEERVRGMLQVAIDLAERGAYVYDHVYDHSANGDGRTAGSAAAGVMLGEHATSPTPSPSHASPQD